MSMELSQAVMFDIQKFQLPAHTPNHVDHYPFQTEPTDTVITRANGAAETKSGHASNNCTKKKLSII